jgi:hypothetical protein
MPFSVINRLSIILTQIVMTVTLIEKVKDYTT